MLRTSGNRGAAIDGYMNIDKAGGINEWIGAPSGYSPANVWSVVLGISK